MIYIRTYMEVRIGTELKKTTENELKQKFIQG